MSHFAVMVIGDNVEEQLQPYHEYECTGIKDEHVEWVDETHEVTEGWGKDTVNTVKLNGKVLSAYDNEVREYERDNPELERFETPVQEFYENIEEYAERYHGYERNGDQFGRYTNPNAKWDWWVVGGRWRGFLKVKEGADAIVGEPGVFGNEAQEGYADVLFKRDIDLDGMRQDAAREANERYDKFEQAVAGYEKPPFKNWTEVREAYGIEQLDEAREAYNEHPYIKATKDAGINPFFDCVLDVYCVFTGGREAYVKRAIDGCMTPFAIVKDGQWYERGSMGWWGVVTDEQDYDTWNKEFTKLIDDVPGDTLITVVDCHI